MSHSLGTPQEQGLVGDGASRTEAESRVEAPSQSSSSPRRRLRGLYVITHALPNHDVSPLPGGKFAIPGGSTGNAHLVMAQAALDGGARIIQLRDKTLTLPRLLPVARALRAMTGQYGAVFIINDRVDVALAADADGVHLGPDDMPVADARRLLGAHRVIGASCANPDEARRAERDGADYIGAGAVFGTATKSDAGAAIGLEALRAIVDATTLPVAAIGGVNTDNIASTRAAGAVMACAVSAIADAGDADAMVEATRSLVEGFSG